MKDLRNTSKNMGMEDMSLQIMEMIKHVETKEQMMKIIDFIAYVLTFY